MDQRVQRLLESRNLEVFVTIAGDKPANGMVERMIQTCRIQLAAVQWDSGNLDWSEGLVATAAIVNAARHSRTGVRPMDLHSEVAETARKSLELLRANGEDKQPPADVNWLSESERPLKWVLVERTDKLKLDIFPAIWEGPFEVVNQSRHAVDIVDIGGKRRTLPLSKVKAYLPDVGEDVETTALRVYNDSNQGEPYYIVSKITDHGPKVKFNLSNLKLRVVYKGYAEEDWYEVKTNRQLLKTEAFASYAKNFPDLRSLAE